MSHVMKMLCSALLLFATACAGSGAPPIQGSANNGTLFTGARLIVGDGTVIEDAAFVVRHDLIMQVGTAGEIRAPAGAVTVDLKGKTVMPALVNAHSHLGWTSELFSQAIFSTSGDPCRRRAAR